MRGRIAVGMLVGVLGPALAVACSSFEAGDKGGSVDAGLEAAFDDVATPTDTGTDAVTGPGCSEKIVYVAPSGNDSSTGCTKTAPKLTIGGAVAYVKTLGLTGYEIRACRGTYAESFTLDYPVSLSGGYECTTWGRVSGYGLTGFDATTGQAMGFDTTNETAIIAPTTRPIAVDISGAAITHDVVIEGITMRGRNEDGGTAVRIHDGAAPTFANDIIVGAQAGAQNADFASTGVEVADTAAPEFSKCRIYGGKGTGARYGSVGVRLHTSGKVLLHENELSGGDGVGTTTSTIAVMVDTPTVLAGANALQNNTVLFGGTAAAAADAVAAEGVHVVAGARADVWDNRVLGQQHTCTPMQCNSFGVFINGTGSRVLRNRVYGGQMTSPSTTDPGGVYGIIAFVDAADVQIVNNVVHTGKVVAPSKVSTFGIALAQGGSARLVAHNTLFSPDDQMSAGIYSVGKDTRIQNNLFLGVNTGLATGDCTNADKLVFTPPALVQNNAFVTAPSAFLGRTYGPLCVSAETTTSVKDTETKLGAATANGNLALRPACGTENAAQCHACTGPNTCFKDLLGAAPGLPSLLADVPMAPLPNAWCGIVRGGVDLGSDAQLDVTKRVRTPQATIGAVELADKSTCVP